MSASACVGVTSTVAESTEPIVRVSNARIPPGVSSPCPRNGRRAIRTPSATTGAKLRPRPSPTSSRSAVLPTDAEFVLAAPTTDSHAVTGCTTANDAMVGDVRGLGDSASLVIHVATGAVTETSHVVGPVLKPADATPVAISRRCNARSVRVVVSLSADGVGRADVASSIRSVCVVTRVARSTEKPNDSSTLRTFRITPPSNRPIVPTSMRRETVVSARIPSKPPTTDVGLPPINRPAALPFTSARP